MLKKEVLLVLTDRWADWEAAYAIAGINDESAYIVKTVAIDLTSKTSIGGLRAEIDCCIEDCCNFENVSLIILPGGYSWRENKYPEIASFVRNASTHGVPVAAICGATIFLGKHGILDNIRHTGDNLESFQREQGYNGKDYYAAAQIVNDKGFITANETAAVEFAHVIFDTLKIDTDKEIELWYDKFKYGMVR
jgi:putative intracellular protease/amidase